MAGQSSESRHGGEPLIMGAVALLLAGAELVLRELIVPLLALALTLLSRMPRSDARPPRREAQTPLQVQTPATHPLAAIAAGLEQCTTAELRNMAGTRSKKHRKHELIAALVAC